ncbi:hypothetical protein RV14_GL000259 [Enterococcus ratti]|uniref:Uncharacterized protein n=1 Tax=Enterococcus ratti TaxID=150033 RepID=A0A1L8WLS9_9ENTE|nr:hypothetical protein RV14_GL000259 [Enterococcus ratti]
MPYFQLKKEQNEENYSFTIYILEIGLISWDVWSDQTNNSQEVYCVSPFFLSIKQRESIVFDTH